MLRGGRTLYHLGYLQTNPDCTACHLSDFNCTIIPFGERDCSFETSASDIELSWRIRVCKLKQAPSSRSFWRRVRRNSTPSLVRRFPLRPNTLRLLKLGRTSTRPLKLLSSIPVLPNPSFSSLTVLRLASSICTTSTSLSPIFCSLPSVLHLLDSRALTVKMGLSPRASPLSPLHPPSAGRSTCMEDRSKSLFFRSISSRLLPPLFTCSAVTTASA
mmetsp:Transcript_33177/g.104923  ORF Transcript_33177/g.104923 Transcript_33177/m.104923 type:complete len:216 (+) Transcript_33177:187-834(+)